MFVELFLFWIDGHEDTRRLHSWDVHSWMYTIPRPHVGCTDVDPSMDRCSSPSFGLLESGCSCVRPQWGEEHSKYVTESRRQLLVVWNVTLKNEAFPYVDLMKSMDCGIMSCLWAREDFMCSDHSVCECTSLFDLNYLTFTSGIPFWRLTPFFVILFKRSLIFGTYYFLIEDKTDPVGCIFHLGINLLV